jgi:tight adherence protein B
MSARLHPSHSSTHTSADTSAKRGVLRSGVALLTVLAALLSGLLGLGSLSASAATSAEPAAGKSPSTSGPTVDIVIAIDNAPRLSNERFEASKSAALGALRSVPNSKIAIVTFGGQVSLYSELVASADALRSFVSLSQDTGELSSEGAQSQMAQGVALALDTLAGSTATRKSVVIVTDGTDSGSAISVGGVAKIAATNGAKLAVIDTRVDGDVEPVKQSVLGSLTKNGGFTAKVTDRASLASLGIAVGQAISAPSDLALSESAAGGGLFGNTLVLGFATLLFGAAIFAVGFKLSGPKEVKVNLTGIPLPEKRAETKTPMAGIASKLTELADKKLEDSGKGSFMQAWLERASINLRSGEFLVIAMAASTASVGVTYFLKGKLFAIIVAVASPFAAKFYVNRRANKRSRKFSDQLSDTLQLISSSMRAGQGFMQALDAVAKESDSPTAEEFHRVVVETRLGRDLVDAMKALAERTRCIDLEWVIPAVEINREVGGDLAEVLEQVGTTIRDRADLRRQVKTLSAEGRLSAMVLIALPIVLGLFIRMSNPEYMGVLFELPGLYLLGGAGILMLVGSIWLFNICKIEF